MPRIRLFENTSWQLWLLCAFIITTFSIGGGSRADASSLIILRPLSIACCAAGLWSLTYEQARAFRALFVFAGCVFGLVTLHLIPLPPSIWQSLPGRALETQITETINLAQPWRPLTLSPRGTANALFSLFVPLAVLLLAAQISRREWHYVVKILSVMAMISALLAIVQFTGSADSNAYFYRYTDRGWAVGPFANRNHYAIFCSMMMPVFFLSRINSRVHASVRVQIGAAIVGIATLLPMILVSGSRIGLVTAAISFIAIMLLFGTTPLRSIRLGRMQIDIRLCLSVATIALAVTTYLFVKRQGISRFLATEQADDLRLKLLEPVFSIAKTFLPLGSGIGSFEVAYSINEPTALLRPTYLNHAHNDWLEVVMTAGIPGSVLLIAATIGVASLIYRAWRPVDQNDRDADTTYARVGSVMLVVLACGSATDYPLRVPSLAAIAVLAIIWLYGSRNHCDSDTGRP
jgi:O-antigen ligase